MRLRWPSSGGFKRRRPRCFQPAVGAGLFLLLGILTLTTPWAADFERPRLGIAREVAGNAVRVTWETHPDALYTLTETAGMAPASTPLQSRLFAHQSGTSMHRSPLSLDGSRLFRLRVVHPRTVVEDDFERSGPGPMPFGVPPLGEPWIAIGFGGVLPSAHGYLLDGDYVTGSTGTHAVTYLCQVLPDPPCLLEADFRWEAMEGEGLDGVLAMACSPGNQPTWIHNLVHVWIGRSKLSIDLMEEGRFRSLAAVYLPKLPLGIRHRCQVYLDLHAGCVLVILNGQPALRASHPDIRRLGGPYVFWEHYYDNPRPASRLFVERVAAAVP